MKKFWSISSFLIILGALVITGCNLPIASEDETSTPEIPVVVATDVTPEGPVDMLQAAARDAALAYIQANYPTLAPPSDLPWNFENITEGGLIGSSSFKYSAETWMITITAPVVAPDAVIYHVEVVNEGSPFRWEGDVDANGKVTEISSTGGGVPVVGWLGYVASTPQGAQFDDYVVILPEDVGEFGIEGTDESIEAEIVALRDHEEPGKYANFWGMLRCDVIDYGGCQLLVTRIRSGIDITDPDPVEGWEGTIVELSYDEPGAPHPDDAFIPVGDYPVQYGIASYIAENGWPIYKEELENRRDTGQTIRVSGQLICGVPDVNGCQIQVNHIEIDGTEVDAYEDWVTYVNEFYGYQFRSPAGSTITEHGPDGFPNEELPEGMTAEEYMEQLTEMYSDQLCVGIQYSYGYISILAPIDSEFRYAICGRTGVGAGELIDKSEEIFVAGGMVTAKGFEFIGSSEMLPDHNETLVLTLADGTRIEYGARPVEGATYEDYLTEAKLVLLQILSTYEVFE